MNNLDVDSYYDYLLEESQRDYGYNSIGECDRCGSYVYSDEEYYEDYVQLICEDCRDED